MRWMVETGESQGVCRSAVQIQQRTRDPVSDEVDSEKGYCRLFSELHICAMACVHLNIHTHTHSNDNSNIVIPDFLRTKVKDISVTTRISLCFFLLCVCLHNASPLHMGTHSLVEIKRQVGVLLLKQNTPGYWRSQD